MDRPKGSAHPRISTLIYPLDYGFLSGTRSGDGHGVDVWIGSLKRRVITGVVCTGDLSRHDTEREDLLRLHPGRATAHLSDTHYRPVGTRPASSSGRAPGQCSVGGKGRRPR